MAQSLHLSVRPDHSGGQLRLKCLTKVAMVKDFLPAQLHSMTYVSCS